MDITFHAANCSTSYTELLHILVQQDEIFQSNHCRCFVPRATIDLEPKIRTAEENLILQYLQRKQLFVSLVSVCTTNVKSYVCLFIQEPFASVMSYSRVPFWNRYGKRFFRFRIF